MYIVDRFVNDYCMFDFYLPARHSDKTKEKISEEMRKLCDEYYTEVKTMIKANRKVLDILANELNNKKILFSSDIEKIINDALSTLPERRWSNV